MEQLQLPVRYDLVLFIILLHTIMSYLLKHLTREIKRYVSHRFDESNIILKIDVVIDCIPVCMEYWH